MVACAFLLTLPATAAEKQPAKTPAKATASVKAYRSAWPPETFSATIMNVDPAQRLLIVKGPDGTPFDLVITARTRIESGSHMLKLNDLQAHSNKTVSGSIRTRARRRRRAIDSSRGLTSTAGPAAGHESGGPQFT